MKILLATDGSACSEAAVEAVCQRPWPAGSEVKVLHVIHASVPMVGDPFFLGFAIHEDLLEREREAAPERVAKVVQQIRERAVDLKVETAVLEGSPKMMIVEEAERWGADLILLGSHGRGPFGRFVLGSVAHAVVLHAHCSVEVVRRPAVQDREASASAAL